MLTVNVNEHTEQKNGLTYLSWAWAWAEVLKHDPEAHWEAIEFAQENGTLAPCMYVGNGTAMVKTAVTIKGLRRVCLLPVMDHRNKAIPQPDAFAINTAIMRCMTKAVSMHGLGLYIYAGEDFPEPSSPAGDDPERVQWLASAKAELDASTSVGHLKRLLDECIATASKQGDDSAINQLKAWADEKLAAVRAKKGAAT